MKKTGQNEEKQISQNFAGEPFLNTNLQNHNTMSLPFFTPEQSIIEILLIDYTQSGKSTTHFKNIVHANENQKQTPIKFKDISALRPRFAKQQGQQKLRTKQRAEVYTPSWIVELQNSAVDQEFSSLTLDEYVDKLWLEITAGEAPYITSRYHMDSGEFIPLNQRVGFLDRKLARINQEITTVEDWLDYAKRAYQATYGFEYQGDSLYIGRMNAFLTFIENYHQQFDDLPPFDWQIQIAKIVSWNIFQMDGLSYTKPETEEIEIEDTQLDLFVEVSPKIKKNKVDVKIMDWQLNKKVLFKSLVENNK